MQPGHESEPRAEPLVRRLTVVGIWLLVVNGMIGAGIFGVGAEAARLTGGFSPWMYLVCGLAMTPVILTFGEAASYFRGTGGPILYAKTAFGPLVAFQTGWAFYFARATGLAANINLLIASIALFWPAAGDGPTRIALLCLIIGGLTWVNVTGTGGAMRTVGVLTVLKFVPLLCLVIWGLPSLHTDIFVAPVLQLPDGSAFGAALVLMVYAFVGFESALVPAGEARDPTRDMARALTLSLVIVTLLYFLIQAVSVSVLPDIATSERPLVDAANTLIGSGGAILLTAGVIASVAGNMAGAMFSTPRMTYAMARERHLPAAFEYVHPRYLTPSVSVMAFGGLVLALAVTGSFVWLAGISVLTRLLIYLVCIGAIPTMRSRLSGEPGAFQLPGGYAVPIFAALVCIGLLTQVAFDAWLVTLVFLAVGSALYALTRYIWNSGRRTTRPSSSSRTGT